MSNPLQSPPFIKSHAEVLSCSIKLLTFPAKLFIAGSFFKRLPPKYHFLLPQTLPSFLHFDCRKIGKRLEINRLKVV